MYLSLNYKINHDNIYYMKKINLTIALLLALVVVVPTNAIAATSLNTTFQSNRGTGPDNFIYNVDMQSDGKVLIVGRITSYNGIPTGELARINTDGSLDTTFNNNLIAGSGGGASGLGGAGYTYFADVQTDGKILVVGNFTTYGSTPVYRIARFNSDGTPDSTFMTNVGTGANNYAFQVQQLQSGKILVDGAFSTFNGTTVSGVVLLNSDGTTDTSFTTNLGTGFVGGTDRNFAETADGKIIIMGDFTSLNGTTVGGIVRLNADGTIDNTFNQGAGFAGGYPYGATAQSNGKLLVVSSATTYDGATISNLVRLNSDGTLDTDFVTNVGSTNNVYKTAVQADGKILVSGAFNTFNGLSVNKIIRLNSDGTTDTSFVTDIGTGFSDGLSKEVGGMVVDSSGNIALGSRTGSFNGVSNTHYLIKLLTDIVIPDTTAPIISEVTPIPAGTDTTPDYTFTTNEAGAITYGGSCSSATTAATSGSNTITFGTLTPGTYSNCTITVTDTALNVSNILAVTSFTISVIPDTTAPIISEVTPIPAGTDTTPDYTFTTNEAGAITYGGSCSSATTAATSGSNTITFGTLTPGTYSNCTITVTDTALNVSNILAVTSFTISVPASEPTPVSTPVQGPTAVSIPTLSSAEIQRIFGATSNSNNASTTKGTSTIKNTVRINNVSNASSTVSLVPNVNETCDAYLVGTMRLGDKNNAEEVLKLQKFLNEFEGENLVVNGLYDSTTSQAIVRFQEKYKKHVLLPWGLTRGTGVVSQTTRAKINALVCGRTYGCPYFSEYYRAGASGSEVDKIKSFLNLLNPAAKLNVNSSIYDTKMRLQVISFQNRYKDTVLKPWGLNYATSNWFKTSVSSANEIMGCTI